MHQIWLVIFQYEKDIQILKDQFWNRVQILEVRSEMRSETRDGKSYVLKLAKGFQNESSHRH